MNKFIAPCLTIGIASLLSFPSMSSARDLTEPTVATTKKHVKTIGMDEYRQLVENPGSALIIDVREPHEYAAGHIPGSINIPRGVIESQIWNHVGPPDKADMGKPIILQCQAGRRASLAAQSLEALGFTHTTAVVMSLDEWQKAGHPFIK